MKRRTTWILTMCIIASMTLMCSSGSAAPPNKNIKSKFYDFNEQLIDGQTRKPTALYTNVREKVKFERLLRLKKSFLRNMFGTSKNPIFK